MTEATTVIEGFNTPRLAAERRCRRRVQGLPCGIIPFIKNIFSIFLISPYTVRL
jgi:hypothetical protein